jgi:cytochrome c biogenesis protein CcmG/thiol:disulfide interchange protein DsbE
VRFAARTVNGDSIRIGPGEKPTLIAVFATWCRSCRDESPLIDSLSAALSPRGVRVLALNVDKDTDEAVRRWMQSVKAVYPAARDSGNTISSMLGVVGVPEFHLIDGEGKITFVRRGPIRSSLSLLRARLGG